MEAALLMIMVHSCKRTQIKICQGKGCRGRVEKGSKQGASSCPLLRECEQCSLLLVVICDSTSAGLMTRKRTWFAGFKFLLDPDHVGKVDQPLTFSLSRETVMLRGPRALIISHMVRLPRGQAPTVQVNVLFGRTLCVLSHVFEGGIGAALSSTGIGQQEALHWNSP